MALPFFCASILVAIEIILVSIAILIVLNYYMMRNSDYILTENGSEEYGAIKLRMGKLLIDCSKVCDQWYPALSFPLL